LQKLCELFDEWGTLQVMQTSQADASLQSLVFRTLGNLHMDLIRDGRRSDLLIDHVLRMMRTHPHAAAVQSSACHLLHCLCEGGKETFSFRHASTADAARLLERDEFVATCVRSKLANGAYLKDSSAVALVLDAIQRHAANAEVQTHALQLVRVLFRFSELHENVAPHSYFVELMFGMIRGQPVYPAAHADAAEALCAIASVAVARVKILQLDGVRCVLERLLSDSEEPCTTLVERAAASLLGTAAALAVEPAGKLRLLYHGALGVVLGVLGKFEGSVDVHAAASSLLARCIAGDTHSRRILGSLGAFDRLLAACVRFQSDRTCCGGLLTVIASISADSELMRSLMGGLSSQTTLLLGEDGVFGLAKHLIARWSQLDFIDPQIVIAAVSIVGSLAAIGAEQRAKAQALGMVRCLAYLLGINAGKGDDPDCASQVLPGANSHLIRLPIIGAAFEAIKQLIADAQSLSEFIACGCIEGLVQLLHQTPAQRSGDEIHTAGFAVVGRALATRTSSRAEAHAHAESEADLLAVAVGRKFLAAGGLKAVQLAIERWPRNVRLQQHVCDVLDQLSALGPLFCFEMGAMGLVRNLIELVCALEVQDPATAATLAVLIGRIQSETSRQRQETAIPALLALPRKLR
jgi:hypothetical protein